MIKYIRESLSLRKVTLVQYRAKTLCRSENVNQLMCTYMQNETIGVVFKVEFSIHPLLWLGLVTMLLTKIHLLPEISMADIKLDCMQYSPKYSCR